MKTTLIVLFSCATLSFAQDMKTGPKTQLLPESPSATAADPASGSQEYKRLASVTWDLDTHKLVWVVQKGVEVNGAFVAKTSDRYEVSPSEASMALKDLKRNIDGDEANSLHDLLSILTMYCVQSTVWWENGGEDAADPAAAKPGKKTVDERIAPSADPNAKPTRVDQPEKKPAVPLLPGALVAVNGIAK